MKAYDNKTALFKSILKTVMDPPGGLKLMARGKYPEHILGAYLSLHTNPEFTLRYQ